MKLSHAQFTLMLVARSFGAVLMPPVDRVEEGSGDILPFARLLCLDIRILEHPLEFAFFSGVARTDGIVYHVPDSA
jgi:hypothetical protein